MGTCLGLKIERQWIFSNTTDNHPGNIDGNNAQQGTACRGKFYVNNCEEKLIHIFDNSGHLGSIPGGAGWGCARDDAGNIVVRDDKNTNGKHSFMVYPADVLPGTTAEAVRFEVEVPMVGQTMDALRAHGVQPVLGVVGDRAHITRGRSVVVKLFRGMDTGNSAGGYCDYIHPVALVGKEIDMAAFLRKKVARGIGHHHGSRPQRHRRLRPDCGGRQPCAAS